jgi:hypothetical protein
MTIAEPQLFAPPSKSLRRGDDGSSMRRSQTALAPHPASVAGMFRTAAAAHPERTLERRRSLVERLFTDPPHPDVIHR